MSNFFGSLISYQRFEEQNHCFLIGLRLMKLSFLWSEERKKYWRNCKKNISNAKKSYRVQMAQQSENE